MKKDIKCEKCGKVLGWYDHKERIINVFDKDGNIEDTGRKTIVTVKCCDIVQHIELK
jgi:transcription initiation factor IIE alpha subunit